MSNTRRTSLATCMLLLACSSCHAPTVTHESPSPIMTDTMTKNKEAVRRLYEEAINAGRTELFDELVTPSYAAPDGSRGPSAFAGTIDVLRGAFPNIQYTIEDLIAEGDRVVTRWTWKGTHEGAFRSFAATGKEVTSVGVAVHRMKDGKVAEIWLLTDRAGFLEQLGAIPAGLIGGPPPKK